MLHRPAVAFALARSDGLLVEQVGPETVIYDSESREAHCLSPVAAAVFADADGHTGVKDLAIRAASATGEQVDEAQVEAALAQLEERGLLVAPPNGISRRQLMRRTAAATAAVSAVPMITSIITPASAQGPGTPPGDCPRSMCAADSDGDDFCACNNECPCLGGQAPCDQGAIDKCNKTKEFGGTNPTSDPPYLDSCECLKCPGHPNSTDQGDFSGKAALADALCAPLYGNDYRTNSTRPSCSSVTDGVGGCNDDSKHLNGVCARLEILTTGSLGDTTEPCPT